jgi:hypothetical protein
MNEMKQLPLAAALVAIGFGVSGNAQAEAYTLAYQNIQNGTITFFQTGTNTQTPVSNVDGTTTSESSAELGATTVGDSQTLPRGTTPPSDADCSSLGAACTENAFIPFASGGDYAYGDAQIVSEQINPGDTFAATNIAQTDLTSSETGSALGGNESTTGFELIFDVTGGPVDLLLDYDNDPYMQVFTDATGQTATATLTTTFTLVYQTDGDIISWNPNGTAQGVGSSDIIYTNIGGGLAAVPAASDEQNDDASTNLSLNVVGTNVGPLTYDPTGDASFGGGAIPNSSNYTLLLVGLPQGSYSLNLALQESSFARNTTAGVPEPEVVGMLALGLLGLGFSSRRRHQAV